MGKNCGPTRYFLGANTSEGFYSCYHEFPPAEEGAFVWYIKGGPGNGKSTLMRRVAQAAEERGWQSEYAFCSGDPDSLDGIYIRPARVGFVDATSPHVREPEEPGASGRYLDLSGCYRQGLGERREEIRGFFRRYREQYEQSYGLLKAAALLAPDRVPGLVREEDRAAAAEQARAFALMLEPEGGYRREHRFLSAHTCQGFVSLWEGVEAERFFPLDDRRGLADGFLQELNRRCQTLGCRVILCPDPLRPRRLEGLILPEQSMAFAGVPEGAPLPRHAGEPVRLGASSAPAAWVQAELLRRRAIQTELLEQARGALREAKRLHDELELLYRPYMDFSAVDALIRQQIELL